MPVNRNGSGCIRSTNRNTPALECFDPEAGYLAKPLRIGTKRLSHTGSCFDRNVGPILESVARLIKVTSSHRMRFVSAGGRAEPAMLGASEVWRAHRLRAGSIDDNAVPSPRRAKSSTSIFVIIQPSRKSGSRQAVRISQNGRHPGICGADSPTERILVQWRSPQVRNPEDARNAWTR